MNRITFQAIMWMILGVAAQAEVELTSKTTLQGDIRALFFQEDAAKTAQATGVGLNAWIEQTCLFTDNLVWEIGGGVAGMAAESDPGVAADFGMAKAGESALEDSQNYGILSRLNGRLNLGKGFVKAGYQVVETPLAGRHDIRLIPNSFLGAVAGYGKETKMQVGYLSHMAGSDSTRMENPYAYHSLADAALGQLGLNDAAVDDKGVGLFGISNGTEEEGGRYQFWGYLMPEPVEGLGDVRALYLDGGLSIDNVDIAAQYITMDNDIWMNMIMGARLSMEFDRLEVTVAMNSYTANIHDQTKLAALGLSTAHAPLWYAWGGKPEFVSGEEVDGRYANWGDASADTNTSTYVSEKSGSTAYMLNLLYQSSDALSLSLGYLHYMDRVGVVQAMAEFGFGESVSLFILGEHKMYDKSYAEAAGIEETATIVEGKLGYFF